jgi:hypothetical protein
VINRGIDLNPLLFNAYEDRIEYVSGDDAFLPALRKQVESKEFKRDFKSAIGQKTNLDLIFDSGETRLLVHMVPVQPPFKEGGLHMKGCVLDFCSVRFGSGTGKPIPRIVVDTCGVIADIPSALTRYLRPEEINGDLTAEFGSCFFDGKRSALFRAALARAGQDKNFWLHVHPHSDISLSHLGERLEFGEYLCYLAAVHLANFQGPSEIPSLISLSSWLQRQGLCRSVGCIGPIPQESTTASLSLAVNADFYVTSSTTCFIFAEACGVTTFLVDRPWNQGLHTANRISSLEDVFPLAAERKFVQSSLAEFVA